jgi:hypothetical protein
MVEDQKILLLLTEMNLIENLLIGTIRTQVL